MDVEAHPYPVSDKAARQKMIDDAEKNGTRVKPEFGSVWYHSMGDPANPTHLWNAGQRSDGQVGFLTGAER